MTIKAKTLFHISYLPQDANYIIADLAPPVQVEIASSLPKLLNEAVQIFDMRFSRPAPATGKPKTSRDFDRLSD